jgi:hypothetical protein
MLGELVAGECGGVVGHIGLDYHSLVARESFELVLAQDGLM